MKNTIFFILMLSTELCSAQNTSVQQEQQQKTQNTVIGVMAAVITVSAIIAVIFSSKAHKQAVADEAKFHACIGKTKSEIYTLYGPPNSIVDDAQGQGGTILEYHKISGSGNRKLFYLNIDNIVTAVKDDSR